MTDRKYLTVIPLEGDPTLIRGDTLRRFPVGPELRVWLGHLYGYADAIFATRDGRWLLCCSYSPRRDRYAGDLPRCHEVRPLVAAEILMRDGKDLPGELVAIVGGEAGPQKPPVVHPPEASPPHDAATTTPPIGPELVEALRRGVGEKSKGSKNRANLVEYMLGRTSATYRDIGHHVHGDACTPGTTIESNVIRTNKDLAELESPLKFILRGEHVIREISPE